ncbi:MAG: fibronectin type III domain-containing protein, partial [Candidatus Micrarchaeota archaeon]
CGGGTPYCVEGKCQATPANQSNNSCTDTDGGQNYGVQGTAYGWYNGAPYSSTDYCTFSVTLTEYWCSGTTKMGSWVNCGGGTPYCINGACLAGNVTPSPSPSPSPQPLPNLITYIGFSNSNPTIGQSVTVYVNTTNYGGGQSGPSHTSSHVSSEWEPHVFAIPSLSPWGGSQMNSYSFTCPYQGWFNFNASADAWYEVIESNEYDNAAYAEVYCAPAVPSPVISSVFAANVTATTAKIYWLTDVSSDSRVEYGLVSGNYSNAAGSPLNTTYHIISLSGLTPGLTKYFYRVRSCAPAGNCAYSGEYSFKTTRLGIPAPQLGLAIALRSGLAEELAQLPAESLPEGQQLAAAAGAVDLSSPSAPGTLQSLRMAVADLKQRLAANKLTTTAVLIGAAAMASAWFFYDKRKAKIRARAKNRK